MYSFHYFLFPFRFDYLKEDIEDRHKFYKDIEFDERVYKKIPFLLKKLQENDWEYKAFDFDNHLSYNEFVYFHDFVKDSLFNLNAINSDEKATSYFFRKNWDNLKLCLEVKKFNGFERTYELDLVSITLRIFDTGIGVLAFEVENNTYPNKEDILNINEYFRRIYPPFIGENFSFEELNKKYMSNFAIYKENKKEEKNKLILSQTLEKDFKDIQNIKGIKISPYILKVLGEDTFTINIKDKGKFLIQPVIDERMFVMCWYGNDTLANLASKYWYFDKECKNLKYLEKIECEKKKLYHQKLLDFWYEFVFVDANGKSIANKKMQKELLNKSTYLRWQEYGTLYGISRYSFVNLTSSEEILKRNFAYYLVENFRGVYYQLVVLSLVVRASVLRFSDEVTAISDLEPSDKLYERVSNLYKNYLRFVNKLYFREITSQEQGIEIYDMFQEIMKLERDVKDLDSEIKKLVEYVYMIQEREENKEMKSLTKIATYLLPPSLIAGFFGMNIFGDNLSIEGVGWLFVVIFIMILSVGVALYLVDRKTFDDLVEKLKGKIKNFIKAFK